jgi:16S rRNA (adenine(1408)-N(1))-methyltransferase
MADSSRRALTSPRRGALANALFVAASVEQPPDELIGIAAELTITFPWGSLLAGALATDPVAAAGIASLIAPGGRVRILLSVIDDDRLSIPPLGERDAAGLAERWACYGLRLGAFRLATPAQVRASGSSWARRLAAGMRRPVWRMDLVREAAMPTDAPTDGSGGPR